MLDRKDEGPGVSSTMTSFADGVMRAVFSCLSMSISFLALEGVTMIDVGTLGVDSLVPLSSRVPDVSGSSTRIEWGAGETHTGDWENCSEVGVPEFAWRGRERKAEEFEKRICAAFVFENWRGR